MHFMIVVWHQLKVMIGRTLINIREIYIFNCMQLYVLCNYFYNYLPTLTNFGHFMMILRIIFIHEKVYMSHLIIICEPSP
jgi:hypothetical protein